MSLEDACFESFHCPFYEHRLLVQWSPRGLVNIQFQSKKPKRSPHVPFAQKLHQTLSDYFETKEPIDPELPIDWDLLHPSAFYKKVWRELRQVPWGQTLRYGELAQRIGAPRAARAIGAACAANPLLLVIPCHRVVATQGLGGFSGGGLDIKRRLLALEGGEPL